MVDDAFGRLPETRRTSRGSDMSGMIAERYWRCVWSRPVGTSFPRLNPTSPLAALPGSRISRHGRQASTWPSRPFRSLRPVLYGWRSLPASPIPCSSLSPARSRHKAGSDRRRRASLAKPGRREARRWLYRPVPQHAGAPPSFLLVFRSVCADAAGDPQPDLWRYRLPE